MHLVSILATAARSRVPLDAEVLVGHLERLRRWVDNRYSDGGRVDTTLPLRGRYSLPAMPAGFSFQWEEKLGRTLELDEESADRRGELCAQANALGVLDVELCLASCQKLCVLTALAGADFDVEFHRDAPVERMIIPYLRLKVYL